MNVCILQVLFHEDGSVKGIATNDVGIHKDGSPKVHVYVFRCEICACMLQTEKCVTKMINFFFYKYSKAYLIVPFFFRKHSKGEWNLMPK